MKNKRSFPELKCVNKQCPRRKDPDNMTWLVQEEQFMCQACGTHQRKGHKELVK